MAKDKIHYFTHDSYSNPNSDKLWYHSGCRLISAGTPTENISEITCERCKSYLYKTHPRYQHHHYVGNLELYFETGMECLGTIFHDNRGLGGPNPNDNGKPFHSLGYTIWFGNRGAVYTIKVFDKENKVVYEGSLTKDKHAIARNKYAYAFLPQEVPAKDWLEWCKAEYRAELYTNELTSALKEGYKAQFDVSQMVEDAVTGTDVVVINVALKTTTPEYYVNSDVRDGHRLECELKAIDFGGRLRAEMKKHAKILAEATKTQKS